MIVSINMNFEAKSHKQNILSNSTQNRLQRMRNPYKPTLNLKLIYTLGADIIVTQYGRAEATKGGQGG